MYTASIVLVAILATYGGVFLSSCTSNSIGSSTTASVLEYHNSPRRDGVYIDSTLTKASAATFHIDLTFNEHYLSYAGKSE